MADVPSPNKEMIEDLNKLGIFDGGEEVLPFIRDRLNIKILPYQRMSNIGI